MKLVLAMLGPGEPQAQADAILDHDLSMRLRQVGVAGYNQVGLVTRGAFEAGTHEPIPVRR